MKFRIGIRFASLLIVGLFMTSFVYAQNHRNKNERPIHHKIKKISEPARFTGWNGKGIDNYLYSHTKYPFQAREDNIQGTVRVSFLICEDGSIGDVRILKDIGGGCGKEATRIIKGMPKWTPATYKGKPVKSIVAYSVEFKMEYR